jgi:hypothetical protein
VPFAPVMVGQGDLKSGGYSCTADALKSASRKSASVSLSVKGGSFDTDCDVVGMGEVVSSTLLCNERPKAMGPPGEGAHDGCA